MVLTDAFINMWSKNLIHILNHRKAIVDSVCELDDNGAAN